MRTGTRTRHIAFTYQPTGKNGRWCKIVPIDPKIFPNAEKGVYELAPARLLGITYMEYLELVTTLFPEKVELRNEPFPVPYWLKDKELFTFVELLNKRWSLMMIGREEVSTDEDTVHGD